jgi:hypothetical protein
MFCPKCATQNLDGARFCRSCGLDISLIPQAMTGRGNAAEPPDEIEDDDRASRRERRRGKKPSLEEGIRGIFGGIGFMVVAIILGFSRFARGWWFWLFIPAFFILGNGIAEYVRAKNAQRDLPAPQPDQTPAAMPRGSYASGLPPRQTGELVPPPPSVTEGTTRHLGAEAPTRVFNHAPEDKK